MRSFTDVKIIQPPTLLGYTRFRKYLSKPELWSYDFWKQLHPGNLAVFQAQEEVSKMYCVKLSLDPDRYLPPKLSVNVKDEELFDNQDDSDDDKKEGHAKERAHTGEVNVCNQLQIHARIASLRTANDLAPNDELSEQQKLDTYYDRANRRDKIKMLSEEEEEELEYEGAASFMHSTSWFFVAPILISV